MKSTILIHLSFLTVFLFSLTSNAVAQTNQENEEDVEEIEKIIPYDKKWNVDIIGDFFENQRTAPLITLDAEENVYLAGTFSDELKDK